MSYNKIKKPTSVVQKVSFPWIAIQNLIEQDENSYIKHQLIVSVNDETSVFKETSFVKQPGALLQRFVCYFQYEKIFNLELGNDDLEKNTTTGLKTQINKKNVKQKKGMNTDEFVKKQEILYQEADFKAFELEKNFGFKNLKFRYSVCHYLYILYWCVEILRGIKSGKNINALIILDAVLSLNRMVKKGDIDNVHYKKGFLFVQERMNRIVNESFYELLFRNPKFLINSSFQNLDSQIRLYKEQTDMIQDIVNSIDTDEALLYANQHPTGQGKTFSCAPLCQLMSKKYNNTLQNQFGGKCLLFACSNSLVRNQLSADILIGNDLHLWLAKHATIVDGKGVYKDKFLIRPYKSCFASNWKKKYKDDDEKKIGSLNSQWEYYVKATQRVPNIIVADLKCCYELLKTDLNLKHNLFVAYIDEFVTDSADAKIMSDICTVLPKQSVLLSSVFPKFENIPSIVSSFCDRYDTTMEKSCKRVSSANIRIPVAIVDKNGYVKFPHHYIESEEDLGVLLEYIRKDPRIRRSYPSAYVYYWSKSLEKYIPDSLQFPKHFPNIGFINQNDSVEYVICLLTFLQNNFHLLQRFQDYSPKKMEAIDPDKIFTEDTFKFEMEGKTLCIFFNPTQKVYELTEDLFKNHEKIDNLLKEMDNKKKNLVKRMETLKKVSTKQDRGNFDKKLNQDNIQNLQGELDAMRITINSKMILNHIEHFKKYHPTEKENTPPDTVSMKEGTYLSNEYFQHFSDRELYQIFSGIGVYDYDHQTKYQRELMMKIYNAFMFFCSGKQIIYGTNLANLCNIFLPSIIAKNLSIPELYQLIGRVGRPGSSNHANIITTDDETTKILLSVDDTYEKETMVEKEMEKKK